MNFLNNINDNSFLLIPNNIKDKILDYINENNLLLNIKIISFNDLKEGLFYSYDNKTIYALMKEYNINYSLAKSYIEDMYYIVEDSYDEPKLKYLLSLFNYLKDNNLLIKDDLFIDLLKSKNKIYVYGYDYINKYNSYLLDIAKQYIDVEIIDKEVKDYTHKAYEANSIEEEVIFVAEEISKLISDGISLDKIYISGLDDEYNFTLRRIFKEYKIPYFIKNNNILYDTAIAKYFFDNLDVEKDELLNNIKRKYNIDNNANNLVIYNSLVNLVNNYYFEDDLTKVKDIMIEESRRITLPSIHMEHEIKHVNIYDNIFNDDEYVFLMNFNSGIFPKIKKDEDYISDDIKPSFVETSKEYNINNKNNLLNIIKSIKNLYITYKLSSPFNKYYPSYLIEDNYEVIKINLKPSNYSNGINKQLFAKSIDNLIKFNTKDDNQAILNNTYDIPYNTYDNSFKGLNNKMDNISYSYTKMSSYFNCPFKFYCTYILGIEEYNDNLNTFIGNVFHHILEVCLHTDIDISEEYDKYVKENMKEDFTYHDLYFIDKVKDEIFTVVDIIREQYKYVDQSYKEEFEKPVKTTTLELGINTKVNAIFTGKVDKVIQVGNNLIVIDYKTGSSDTVVKDMFKYGLHIQLPLYMYLLEVTNPELNVAGIYLQYILKGNNRKIKDKTKYETKQDELKLEGLTLADESIIPLFDSAYEDSDIIRSLKVNKDGSLKKDKTITNEEKQQIEDAMKELIKSCVDNVYDSNFKIEPININNGKEDGCKYCSFRDVCYKNNNQYRRITTEEGDNDE